MKKIFLLLLIILSLLPLAQAQEFKAPDLLIETKLNYDWSGVLISRIRRLLKNMGIGDPFRQTFVESIIVTDSTIQEYLNPKAKELVTDLGEIIGLDILKGKTQVSITGLHYDVRGFKIDLNTSVEKVDGFSIDAGFSASKIRVSAKKLTLTLMLPGKKALPVVNIDIVNPLIIASKKDLINFNAKIKIQDNKEKFNLKLEDSDFTHMSENLVSAAEAINLTFDKLVIPKVSIRVGNKVLNIDNSKIEALLMGRLDAIKSLLVGQLASLLSQGLGNDMLKAIDKVEFDKEFWIDSDELFSKIQIEHFKSDSYTNIMEVSLPGDFCTAAAYKKLAEDCVNQKITQPVKSLISAENHKNSIDHLKTLVDQGDANLVVSISEDYVNKLLVATYDADLWKDMLKEAGIAMGPNKIFFRMDKKGETSGTLYMDLLYTPKKLERWAIGEKVVRFPLVIKASLKIKSEGLVPVFVIHLDGIDTSDETLLYGVPSQNVVSNIQKMRLKKKVLAAIRAETTGLSNKDVLELKYPELSGLGLEQVDFVSDGEGRMNALMLLKEK